MKKILMFILAAGFSLFVFGCGLVPQETTTTETVTADTSTFNEIHDIDDLTGMTMHQSYKLMSDLDLSGVEWEPLGTFEEPFIGHLDGNGHTISNLTITTRNLDFNGLFGVLKGDVFDLTLDQVSIDYSTSFLTYAGALAGKIEGADIDRVTVAADIQVTNASSNTFAGLLAGIVQAHVTDTMTPDEFVANRVTDTTLSGTIDVMSSNYVFAGGIAGKTYNTELSGNQVDVSIQALANDHRIYAGGLSGHHYGGLLVGFEDFVDETSIMITANTVSVTFDVRAQGTMAAVGGLFGYNDYGHVLDNHVNADMVVSGNSFIIGSLIGEDFHGTIENTVSTGSLTISNEPDDITVGDVCGFVTDDTSLTSAYVLFDVPGDFDVSQGETVTLQELSTESFYRDSLGWDDVFDLSRLTGLYSE